MDSTAVESSLKRVSWGLILFKTTEEIEDFPERRGPSSRMRGNGAAMVIVKLCVTEGRELG